jgi:hypothetical protein
LPDGDDWILHGPYIDKSLIRNALAHYMYQVTGRYSPRTRFFELFLNNSYQGVYLLEEKIKRDKNRIDISKMTKADTVGDSLTGGYVFRIDKSDNIDSEGFMSLDNLRFIYNYPKIDNIMSQQKTYLQNKVNNFEKLMKSSTWADQTTGYPAIIDVDAAVDYILEEEISKNTDAYDVSFYMYKERDSKGGKITFGPPWDFNLAFGAVSYSSGMDTTGWEAKNSSLTQSDSYTSYKIPSWIQTIFDDDKFQSKLKARWSVLRSSVWHTKNIDKFIDSLSTVLANAATRNFNRWQILGSATCVNLSHGESNSSSDNNSHYWGNFTYSFCFNGYSEPTWAAEVTHLKNWFHHRLEWIDSKLDFVEPDQPTGVNYSQLNKSAQYVPWCKRTENRLFINDLKGGHLSVYDLRGRCLWNTDVYAGKTAVNLPDCLHGKVCIASLNGHRLLIHSAD